MPIAARLLGSIPVPSPPHALSKFGTIMELARCFTSFTFLTREIEVCSGVACAWFVVLLVCSCAWPFSLHLHFPAAAGYYRDFCT